MVLYGRTAYLTRCGDKVMRQFRMVDLGTTRSMEWWTVVTEDGETVEVEYNGNGGFGPVNIWTGTEYLAVKYRERKRETVQTKSDELLDSIRESIRRWDNHEVSYGELDSGDFSEDIVRKFEELDRYLSSGGPFPVAWHESARRTLHPSVMSDDPWQSPESALKGKEPF